MEDLILLLIILIFCATLSGLVCGFIMGIFLNFKLEYFKKN